jgi:hypothetical protein
MNEAALGFFGGFVAAVLALFSVPLMRLCLQLPELNVGALFVSVRESPWA